MAVGVNHSDDLALDDVVGRTDKHRQFLHYIQEELVLGVLDSLLSPGYYVGDLACCIDG